jgi:hypothetical protein
MVLAISTKRFLTVLALNRILEDVVADAADQLWKKRLDMLRV